jgi:hypothetical protein
MHVDNSDVTFNVCLGKEFTGSGLAFCGYMGEPAHRHLSHTYTHRKGRCVVHLGRRRHGADDIASGERMNLIIWNHNLAYRASRAYVDLQRQRAYAREAGPPDLQCLSYTHDRDYLEYKVHISPVSPLHLPYISPTSPRHLPYLEYKEAPLGHAKMTRRAWCPPLFARHDAPPRKAQGAAGEGAAGGRPGGRRALLRMAAVEDEDDAILDEGGHPDDLDAAGGPEVFGYDTLRELQAALRVPDADGATLTPG